MYSMYAMYSIAFCAVHLKIAKVKVNELLKSVYICQSYCKNSCTFLWITAFIACTIFRVM